MWVGGLGKLWLHLDWFTGTKSCHNLPSLRDDYCEERWLSFNGPVYLQ